MIKPVVPEGTSYRETRVLFPGRPDWFLYARCVVVANGPKFYASVLADPREMPKDMEFETVLTVGPAAFLRKTGEELDHVSPVSYETFSNKSGWRNAEKP